MVRGTWHAAPDLRSPLRGERGPLTQDCIPLVS
jgi:hypothetical protein